MRRNPDDHSEDYQAEQRWHEDVRENVFSVSTGVRAPAAGIAIDEGRLMTWSVCAGRSTSRADRGQQPRF